jgi:membrane protease YdiL (CAAX protease family)
MYGWIIMWCPGAVAIALALLKRTTFLNLGLTNFGGSSLVLGIFLPMVLFAPVYLIASATGFCGLAPFALRGQFLSLILLLPRAVGRALGEEIGWRGFLFPQLRVRYSFPAATLITGLIWALWHFAVIVQGAYLDAPRVPLLVALLLFTIGIVGQSFIYSWLRERSGSIWPAVCVHATFNWFTQRVMAIVLQPNPKTPLAVGEMSVGFAIMGALIAVLFWPGPQRKAGPSCA